MELEDLRSTLEALISTRPTSVMELETQRDDAVRIASDAVDKLEALLKLFQSNDLLKLAIELERDQLGHGFNSHS